MNKILIVVLLGLFIGANSYAIMDDCCQKGEYYKADKGCQACADYCDECEYSNKDQTQDGKGECKCKVDNANCMTCTKADECDKCKDGYFISEKKCSPCGTDCAKCAKKETCDECKKDMFAKSNGDCGKMIDNCMTMKSGSEYKCEKCKSMYGLTSDAECKKCPDNCTECDPTKSDECSACTANDVANMQYYTIVDKKCMKCHKGCKECIAENKCKDTNSCVDKWAYHTTDKVCKECPTDCLECNGEIKCTKCKDGMRPNAESTACEACGANYTTCDQTAGVDGAATDLCGDKGGYNSGTKKCVACVEGCVKCSTHEDCTECGESLWFNADTKKCDKKCEDTTENTHIKSCNIANGADIVCKDGYTHADTKCVTACGTKCKVCEKTAVDGYQPCTTCMATNQYKNDPADGKCTECETNCLTCDKDKCTKCKDKFRINGKKCDACPANCDMCDAADGKCDADKCTKNDKGEVYRYGDDCHEADAQPCAAKKYFDNDAKSKKCMDCITGCDKCNAKESCITCATGRGYKSQKCETCTNKDANIMHCQSDLSLIESCKSGWMKSSDSKKCEQCIANCATCEDTKKCKENGCMPGYTHNKEMDKCLECAPGCMTCSTTCNKGCDVCFGELKTENMCACGDNEEWSAKDKKCNAKVDVTTPKKTDTAATPAAAYGSILKFTQFFLICLVLFLSNMI